MNPSELAKILELHKVWISSFGKAGSKANLYGADLSDADLSDAN